MLAPGLTPTRQGRSSDILNTGNNAHQNPSHGAYGVFPDRSSRLDGPVYGGLGDFIDVSADLSSGLHDSVNRSSGNERDVRPHIGGPLHGVSGSLAGCAHNVTADLTHADDYPLCYTFSPVQKTGARFLRGRDSPLENIAHHRNRLVRNVSGGPYRV